MDYAAASHFAQTFGLALLVLLFVGVLVYALWPGNRKKFDRAARTPLQDDDAGKGEVKGGANGEAKGEAKGED